jgi:hypothetical protein
MNHGSRRVDAARLTTFEVDVDGAGVSLHLLDRDGSPVTVALPFSSLGQLLMTLPTMIGIALRRSSGDDSHRLVYPIERCRLELGEVNGEGLSQFILSLETKDGFSVSFALSAELLTDLGRSLLEEVDTPLAGVAPSVRLS